jgi:hypothetical protein
MPCFKADEAITVRRLDILTELDNSPDTQRPIHPSTEVSNKVWFVKEAIPVYREIISYLKVNLQKLQGLS